jgi:hypothetical protein
VGQLLCWPRHQYRALRPARVHGQTGGACRTVAMEATQENRKRSLSGIESTPLYVESGVFCFPCEARPRLSIDTHTRRVTICISPLSRRSCAAVLAAELLQSWGKRVWVAGGFPAPFSQTSVVQVHACGSPGKNSTQSHTCNTSRTRHSTQTEPRANVSVAQSTNQALQPSAGVHVLIRIVPPPLLFLLLVLPALLLLLVGLLFLL